MLKAFAKEYRYLEDEKSPRILINAMDLHGTLESPGTANNPAIMAWAKEVGGNVADLYNADSIPWCGLFVAVCAKRAGLELPATPLWALSWAKWGNPADAAMLGDVLVFKREGGGHVGIYVGEDDTAYHVLGGNQGDAVTIARIAKARFHAARRTPWKVKQPDNIRRIILTAGGGLSKNEA